MRLVRVHSGEARESHFEDLTPEQFAELVFPIGQERRLPWASPGISFIFRLPHLSRSDSPW